MSTPAESSAEQPQDLNRPLTKEEQTKLIAIVTRKLEEQPDVPVRIGRQGISTKAQLTSILKYLADKPVLVTSGFNRDAQIMLKVEPASNQESVGVQQQVSKDATESRRHVYDHLMG